MNAEEAKIQCLVMSGGNVDNAKKMLEWIYPIPAPKVVTSDLRAEKELCQAMTVGRIGTPKTLTDIDGRQWFYSGEDHGWMQVT
jgi:hypothetical protein